ncbi:MAG: RHS repeat-associated core domain-containing protein, partial [Nitrospirota bacterium]
TYGYDIHGNMLNLANVAPGQHLQWDHRDMIKSLDLVGGGITHYQYDSGKQRTRKYLKRAVTNPDGSKRWVRHWERIYLGGHELYRRYNGNGTTVVEEIESHHLFEGEQHVLLVDDVITASGMANPRPDGLSVQAQTLFRYQYGNHLGSACLELDDQAEIISYEEYHSYGTAAYRAMKSGIGAPPKRYQYTGKERDEESGLYYHGARYYAPWLVRWTNCDPAGTLDGLNLYSYIRANPLRYVDATGNYSKETFATTFKSVSEVEAPAKPKKGEPDAILLQLRKAQEIATPSDPASVLSAVLGRFGQTMSIADKYLYTTHAGIVDIGHFFGTARFVYGGQEIEGHADAKSKYLKEKERDEVSDTTGSYAADDLPSNALGALFAEHLISIKDKGKVDVTMEASKFFAKLGALETKDTEKLIEKFQPHAFRREEAHKALSAEPQPITDDIIKATGGETSPFSHLKGKTGEELLALAGIELDPTLKVKTGGGPEAKEASIGLRLIGGKEPKKEGSTGYLERVAPLRFRLLPDQPSERPASGIRQWGAGRL